MAELPRAFGRYRVTRSLGEGAMGSVYVAQDEVLGREVAVKTIRPTAMPIGGAERFVQEGRAAAQLAHAHIVRVFDVGTQDGVQFMVMELASGGSLKERIVRGALPVHEVRKLGIQIAHALGAAHERGIVHRDVKPANILEAAAGTWKLADFGIAHLPDSTLTLAGQFLGSPAYAAPESLRAGVFVPASDVYALAATLFEAATGRQLHEQGLEGRLKAAEASVEVQRSRMLDLDAPGLVDAIAHGLAPAPHERPTAAALAVMIAEAVAAPTSTPAVPRAFATPPAGVGVVTPAGIGVVAPPKGVDTVALADSVAVPPKHADTVALRPAASHAPGSNSPHTEFVPDAPAAHPPQHTQFVPDAPQFTQFVPDAPAPNLPLHTHSVPDVPAASNAAPSPQTQFVADSMIAPPPPRRRSKPLLVIAAAAVALIVIVSVVASRRGGSPGSGSGSAATVTPDAPVDAAVVVATPDAADVQLDPDEPPLEPGEIRIVTPRAAIDRRDAGKAWRKVVDKIYEGHFESALEKLDDWEHDFDATAETRSLRAQLEKLRGSEGRENGDKRHERED
jgi:serine/threonine protein kinase